MLMSNEVKNNVVESAFIKNIILSNKVHSMSWGKPRYNTKGKIKYQMSLVNGSSQGSFSFMELK